MKHWKPLTMIALTFCAIMPLAPAEHHAVAISKQKIEVAMSEAEVECLAKNIYHEARGETLTGMKAVADATMNRLHAGKFGKSVCAVVYAKGQFSWTKKEPPVRDHVSWVASQAIARLVLEQSESPLHHATYYVNRRLKGKFTWMRNMRVVALIGHHVFYAPRA